jgi:N-ethylmaleimide reductase
MYGALLAGLAPLGLAYVHLEATTNEEVLVDLHRVWPGTLVMNPSSPMGPIATDRAAADHWLALGADLISSAARSSPTPTSSSDCASTC